MCPTHEIQVVFVEKLCDDVGPEGEGDAAVVVAPAAKILFRIRPEEIADQSVVRNACRTSYPTDLAKKERKD